MVMLGWAFLAVAAGTFGGLLGRLRSGQGFRPWMFWVALVSAGAAMACFALADWGRP
jgi:hypothetical protein